MPDFNYYTAEQLINGAASSFDGTFQYLTPGDDTTPLVYVVPSGKNGTVSFSAQIRNVDGSEITSIAPDGTTSIVAAVSGNNTLNVGDIPAQTFRSLTELKTMMDSASEGDVIDLGGDYFRPETMAEADSMPTGISTSKDITLTNGTISATLDTTWTESSTSGVFFTDIPTSGNVNITYDDPRVYVVDDSQTEAPFLQARRKDTRPLYGKYNGLSKCDIWYFMDGTDGTRTLSGDFAVSITADASVKAEWDSFFAGGASGTTTLFRGSPNVISTVTNSSYDSGTGTLTFDAPTDLPVTAYMEVIFSGLDPASFLDQGEYCFRSSEGRIYYRPVNGDASGARIPCMSKLLRVVPAGKTVTLDNVTVLGTMVGEDSTAGALSSSGNGLGAGIFATRNGTIIRHCGAAIVLAKIDLQDSSFYEFTKRFGSGLSGGQALRNYFGNSANQSTLFFGYSDASNPILVRDNMFNLPASAHGQCVSLYQNSWQNATVEHNIFYNTQRFLSFQPNPSAASDGDPANVGSFVYRNNLAYTDTTRDAEVVSGQAGFSFNGAEAADLDGLGQVIEITNNVHIVSQALLDNQGTNNVAQTNRCATDNAFYMETLHANNIFPQRPAGTQSEYNSSAEPGLGTLSNALYANGLSNRAVGATDLVTSGYTDVYDPTTFAPSGDWSTAATDGGKLGIRWTSVPTAADIATLDRTWAASYPADTLPAVSFPSDANDIVVSGDDKRAGGRAVPNNGSPTNDNSYYRTSPTQGTLEVPAEWGTSVEVRWYNTNKSFSMFLSGTTTEANAWLAANPSGTVRITMTLSSDGTGEFTSMNGTSSVYDLPVSTWSNIGSSTPRAAGWNTYTPVSGLFVYPLPTSAAGDLPSEMDYSIELIA